MKQLHLGCISQTKQTQNASILHILCLRSELQDLIGSCTIPEGYRNETFTPFFRSFPTQRCYGNFIRHTTVWYLKILLLFSIALFFVEIFSVCIREHTHCWYFRNLLPVCSKWHYGFSFPHRYKRWNKNTNNTVNWHTLGPKCGAGFDAISPPLSLP